MAIKKLKAISNSSRNTTLINYKASLFLRKKKTPKKLIEILKKHSGRNNQGKITTRHQGGRQKRYYRKIDFKRNKKDNIWGKTKSIEKDPNRNAFISLVSYKDGSFSFILTPEGIKVNDLIISGKDNSIPIKTGNNLPLKNIPLNILIHNLEIKPGRGAQMVRAAGTWAEIIGKEEKYVLIRIKKEIRKVLAVCRATIGKVSNGESNLVKLGKAGRNRWRGIRPTVRGVAMNPVDHPHGGGEGKTGIGRAPVSPWGKKTLGKKTRKKNRSNKNIIKKR